MSRFLVTGDRDWGNPDVYGEREALRQYDKLRRFLTIWYKVSPDDIMVEGDARGADKLAGSVWLELTGNRDQVEAYPADWTKFKRAAGPIRNRQMITESVKKSEVDGHKLEHAIAFHSHLKDSKGTKDMVVQLRKFFGDERILYLD
jgi:hypothetical protein